MVRYRTGDLLHAAVSLRLFEILEIPGEVKEMILPKLASDDLRDLFEVMA